MPPKNQPPPRSQTAVPLPPLAPAVDASALQKRIGELETQVADLTPRANAHKSQKDDLGRQQFQAHKLQDEARAATERAHQEKLHFEAQRLQLTGDAEAFVAAERAKRLAALEAELGTERARVEKVAAGVRDAAEAAAASLRADAETRLRSATAESGRLRKEADDALADANAEAQKLLATARSEAAAEGVRLREEASRSAQHTKESAQVAAGERVESARIEAAKAIEVARAEAARLLEAARKDSAQLRATAQKELSEAEQARLVAERRAAERVQVEEESARKAAAAKVAPILKDAQERADGINKHADERERAVAEAARKLEDQARALDVRDADVKATARKTAHRDTLNEQLSIELEAQERNLRERQEAFAKAEARVGTVAVARLTEERDEARAMLNASRERNQAIVLERDQIARTLEEAGGIDLAARVLEIEKLRARVGELLAERATMAHEEELAALRAENERLRGVATRVADAEKRARELERAQAGADHAIAVARDQAAREVATANSAVVHHLSEVTRLAAENSALKGEGEALVTRIAGTQRLADEQRSLLIDRDWLEARVRELERTLEDRNKLARLRSKDRYGKLAELDDKPIVSGFEQPEPPPTLKLLTQQARERMAAAGRFYDAHTVQSWMASLAAHRMVVLQGLSGTGKTSLPVHFAEAIGGWCVPVPVQSGWRDKADLFGFYNTFDHRFRASEFTKAVYTANLPDFEDRPVFLVLDECNLSRVEYYFADLLSELQLDSLSCFPSRPPRRTERPTSSTCRTNPMLRLRPGTSLTASTSRCLATSGLSALLTKMSPRSSWPTRPSTARASCRWTAGRSPGNPASARFRQSRGVGSTRLLGWPEKAGRRDPASRSGWGISPQHLKGGSRSPSATGLRCRRLHSSRSTRRRPSKWAAPPRLCGLSARITSWRRESSASCAGSATRGGWTTFGASGRTWPTHGPGSLRQFVLST